MPKRSRRGRTHFGIAQNPNNSFVDNQLLFLDRTQTNNPSPRSVQTNRWPIAIAAYQNIG